jgi:hypothetical protein
MKALAAMCVLGLAGGCSTSRATAEECDRIFERIVDLELHEMGYRDPALAARKKAELRTTLAPDLKRCPGRRLRSGAMDCVNRAESAEEISHRCLR